MIAWAQTSSGAYGQRGWGLDWSVPSSRKPIKGSTLSYHGWWYVGPSKLGIQMGRLSAVDKLSVESTQRQMAHLLQQRSQQPQTACIHTGFPPSPQTGKSRRGVSALKLGSISNTYIYIYTQIYTYVYIYNILLYIYIYTLLSLLSHT